MVASVETSLDISAIRSSLARFAGQIILGSVLGNVIKAHLPTLDFRAYGGLGAFARSQLQGIVTCLGPDLNRGGDERYEVAISLSSNAISTAWNAPQQGGRNVLWQAFARPSAGYRFACASSINSILCSTGQDPVPDGYQHFSPINEEEFREIARAFLQAIPDNIRATFAEICEHPRFFNEWLRALHTHGNPALQWQWNSHRIKSIISLFEQRLRKCDFQPDNIRAWTDLLQISQKTSIEERATRRVVPTYLLGRADISPSLRAALPGRGSSAEQSQTLKQLELARTSLAIDETALRLIVRESLDQLSIEQLRSLPLPLGAILDSLRKIK